MTIDKEKLKPCPFCGGQVQLETVKSRAGTLYGVVCRNTGNRGCTCAMEQVPSRSAEAAIARWNMRKPEEELRVQLDVSEDTLATIRGCLRSAEDEIDQLKADNEALRKQVADFSPFKGAPFTGADTRCLACGEHHYGIGGLPCPKMRVTAQAVGHDDVPDFTPGNGNKARRRAEALGIDYDAATAKQVKP